MNKHSRLPVAGHRASLFMSVAVGGISLTLIEQLMGWVMILLVCAVAVRFLLYKGLYKHAPGTRTINLLAVLASVALAWFAIGQGILITMINLLVVGCALKLLLLNRRRDFLQLAACCLFLVGCAFIFSQSLFSTLLYSLVLFIILLAIQLFFAPQLGFKRHLKKLLKMNLQALPVAVLLFLILPHLPPFWGMPQDKSTATGLSEKITPGDIAKLTRSTDHVFTATFDGAVPEPEQRYWRAMVLEEFDGKSWQVSEYRKQRQQVMTYTRQSYKPAVTGPAFSYQMLTEATGNQWLPVIDIALPGTFASTEKVFSANDYTLRTRQPMLSKQAFDISSFYEASLRVPANGLELNSNLQLPQQTNLRAAAWAQQLRQQHQSNRALAQAVMTYFASQGFSYTLEPPVMPDAPVDTFLFDARQGFCSHYASAMTFVLRSAGIPARIVSGYQGGQNLADNVLSIYQYDAHAWVEASLDNQSWTRFDPTAMVAMSRLQYGFMQAMSEQRQDAPVFSRANPANSTLLNSMFHLLDSVNYQWNRWVLGFDASTQEDMVSSIMGKATGTRMTIFMLSVLLFIAGLLAFYFVPRPVKKGSNEAERLYYDIQKRLEKLTGLPRNHLGPSGYLTLVSPRINAPTRIALERFTRTFGALQYQPHQKHYSISVLRSQHRVLVKALRKHPKGRHQGTTSPMPG